MAAGYKLQQDTNDRMSPLTHITFKADLIGEKILKRLTEVNKGYVN